jgi:hypothetical protein
MATLSDVNGATGERRAALLPSRAGQGTPVTREEKAAIS